MAVAAYASVVSLINVIDNIHYHRHVRQRVLPIMKQVETLEEKVRFLRDFLEAQSPTKMEQIEDLARRIADVAVEADDIIDVHVVDLLRVGESDHDQDTDHLLRSFSREMENVIEKFDSITEELNEQKDGVQQQKVRVSSARPAVSSEGLPPSSGKLTVVGLDERTEKVMEMLMQDQPKLRIVPITGMGGIGKTTLARNVFDNSYIKEKFDRRIWSTISQEYNVREILLDILGLKKEESSASVDELGHRLYKSLCGKRYLIVMDDIWSEKAWYDFNLFFPDNRNGSRVIVTTRLSNMTVSLGCRDPYVMDFLSKDASWNLFSQIALAQDGCSTELEIGRKIVESCKGLPLAIVVIGGLVANSDMTPQQWEFIAENVENVYSFGNSEIDEQCLKVLALSYNHLPIHLKPCFLSLSFYRKGQRIKVSKLIKMWVAYGFLNPLSCKSLEEVANEYLKELVDRNLILLSRETTVLVRKTCVVHDFVRDLCVRESLKEQLCRVPRTQDIIGLQYLYLPYRTSEEDVCFLCSKQTTKERVHLTELHLGSQTTSRVRMPVCRDCRVCYTKVMTLRLVRIKLMSTKEIFLHTKSRYITKQSSDNFSSATPAELHLLWNLLTFEMLGVTDFAPLEIWEMPQLRQVRLFNNLPDPHVEIVSDDVKLQSRKEFTVLENLHTLKGVKQFRCTKEVVERIPNLKKLMFINHHRDEAVDPSSFYSFQNLDHLHKLESLTMFLSFRVKLGNIAFPKSLKKLTLFGGKIPWEDMRIVGSLPNLEKLRLFNDSFIGPEWSLVEEWQFQRLKSLYMSRIDDLVSWNAEKTHFPVLENLDLALMPSLEEIPSCIGEIDTLHSIRIYECHESVVESAKQILEDQQSYGNDALQLTIERNKDNLKQSFRDIQKAKRE